MFKLLFKWDTLNMVRKPTLLTNWYSRSIYRPSSHSMIKTSIFALRSCGVKYTRSISCRQSQISMFVRAWSKPFCLHDFHHVIFRTSPAWNEGSKFPLKRWLNYGRIIGSGRGLFVHLKINSVKNKVGTDV